MSLYRQVVGWYDLTRDQEAEFSRFLSRQIGESHPERWDYSRLQYWLYEWFRAQDCYWEMWYTKGVHRDAKERQDPACQRLSEVASLSVEEALELISATVREGHSDLLREYLPTKHLDEELEAIVREEIEERSHNSKSWVLSRLREKVRIHGRFEYEKVRLMVDANWH